MSDLEPSTIIYITDRQETRVPMRWTRDLGLNVIVMETIGEAVEIPRMFSPAGVKGVFVHRSLSAPERRRQRDGIGLAESLQEQGFRVTLVTGGDIYEKETKIPTINIVDFCDHLEKLAARSSR